MKFLVVIGAIVILNCAIKESVGQSCPVEATPFSDYVCFQQFQKDVTQSNAAGTCAAEFIGSTVVGIKFEVEQRALVDVAKGTSFWTSGRRIGTSNEFKWGDDSLINEGYSNWADGQPGSEQRNQCLLVRTDGKWVAVPCTEPHFVMCQKNILWADGKLQEVLISLRHNLKAQNDELKLSLETLRNSTTTSINKVEGDISAFNGRIGKLETDSTSINGNIITIQTQMGSVVQDLAILGSKATALRTDVDKALGDVGAVGPKVDDAISRISTAEKTLGEVQVSVVALEGSVGTLNTDVEQLKSDLGSAVSRLGVVEVTANENTGKIATNIENIDIALEAITQMTKLVDDVDSKVVALTKRVEELEKP